MVDDSKKTSKKSTSAIKSPARTPEAQEQRMINLSMKQAEKMLMEGRAPSQIVVHFLKLATEKAKLENEKLKADTEMSRSKSEVMQSQKNSEELYGRAIRAFKSYGGGSGVFSSFDEEESDYYE